MPKYSLKMLYCSWVCFNGVQHSVPSQSYHQWIHGYFCFSHPSVPYFDIPSGVGNNSNQMLSVMFLPWSGPLINLACTLLGRMEMELVLSCGHLPYLLSKRFLHLPLICCQVFLLVFVPASSFEIHYIMSLWCESRHKELKKAWNRD